MLVARLSGEADSYVVSREFEQKAAAIAWLQGAGLADLKIRRHLARFGMTKTSYGLNRTCKPRSIAIEMCDAMPLFFCVVELLG